MTPPSDFLLDQRVFPSLGILKVGAVLQQAGYEVDHLDLTGVSNYEEAAASYNKEAVFAITATTPQISAARKIAATVKGHCILGGPHATLVQAAARRGSARAGTALRGLLEDFTTVVAGDGEKAIFRALETEGLIDADDPASELWNSSSEFTASPWPARDLLDLDSYHYSIEGKRAMHMISQLGCPFECGFCGGRFSPMLRRIRSRPTESVVSEMLHLHNQYGIEGINFFDDELNVNKGLIGLCQAIVATKVDWRLRGFVKAELFTPEQAEAMYAAGFRWLLCGFESGHPRILKNINKKATLEENTGMLRIAHRYGLKVKALMSLGHPGESEETVEATRQWLLQEKPDDFDCTVITLYPGTPYFDQSICVEEPIYKYEINGDALYSENTDANAESGCYKGKPGEYQSFVWTDYLTRERLVILRDILEIDVRSRLDIPYPQGAAALQFEHSTGMRLPGSILRRSQ